VLARAYRYNNTFILNVIFKHVNQPLENSPKKSSMKIHLVIIFMLLNTSVAFADSSVLKSRLNLLFLDERLNAHYFLKMPNQPIILPAGYNRAMRTFFQYQLADTGTLYLSLFRGSTIFPPKTLPDRAKINKLHIRENTEKWLVIFDKRRAIKQFYEGNYIFLTKQEFEEQFPRAYKRFQRKGFHAVFENVPVNTPLR
jgi:hypothetical protein